MASQHIYNENEILDFNEQGNENVPSQDFDPGYGCVPVKMKREIVLPPMPYKPISAGLQHSYELMKRTDEENARREDEYLKSKGI